MSDRAVSVLAPGVELHGHRGARGHAPENTIAGFAKALSIGVDALEMDLVMSCDGVLMVHHDLGLNPDIARDPSGGWIEEPVPLIDLDAARIERYDVGRLRPGSRYQARFPLQQPVDGERIPRLERVLRWIARRAPESIRLNIEVKSDPLDPGRCAEPRRLARVLVEQIETARMCSRVLVQSFDWRVQREVAILAPTLPTAYLSSQQAQWDTIRADEPGPSAWTADQDVSAHGGCVASAVHAAGGRVWTPYYRDLDRHVLNAARALGLRVIVWTVNEDDDIARALDLGVDGIISDYPDRVRDALQARGLPLPARLAT